MPIYKWDNQAHEGPNILDNPPMFHEKLCDYGARPYWSPDGKKIVFVERAYGDVHEIDLATRKVTNLTGDNGNHHSFLRALFLPTGDYLLIGPKSFEHHFESRYNQSELWFMDRDAKRPPQPLDLKIFEGIGISATANRITYSRHGGHDPSIGSPDHYECYVSEIEIDSDGARIGETKAIYRGLPGRRPEPQDFRDDDCEVIMADYVGPRDRSGPWKTVTRGINLRSLDVTTYIDEALTHNECEGIFPDGEHISLESSCDLVDQFPPIDLWKLKLDGSQRRVRMTRLFESPPWRASNSNISPDGKWLAFMVNTFTSEPGFGMGLGLLDLEAWEKSDFAEQWETPSERAEKRRSEAAE